MLFALIDEMATHKWTQRATRACSWNKKQNISSPLYKLWQIREATPDLYKIVFTIGGPTVEYRTRVSQGSAELVNPEQ
jgi:hypothetical protein